jgi:hypothetical protein
VFVEGDLEVLPLTGEELRALGSLWTANVLRYATSMLLDAMSTDEWSTSEFAWCRAQLDKTRCYR